MEKYLFQNGDTVRVNPAPTVSRLNGREWPAGVVGYIHGYSWSDRDDCDCAMYSLYGDRDQPQWGIQFAEADLELVEGIEAQRRASIPSTQETLRHLQARVDELEGVLRYIKPNLPEEDRDYSLPGENEPVIDNS